MCVPSRRPRSVYRRISAQICVGRVNNRLNIDVRARRTRRPDTRRETMTAHSDAPRSEKDGGPTTRNGARRRGDILALARRLFLEHGYHDTTTRLIAREAGVSDALLYRYFPSKRDLFDAVIDDGLGHLDPYIRFGAPELQGLRLRETLEAAAYTTAEIVRRDQEVFRLMVQERHLLGDDDRIATILEQLLHHFAARIRYFIDAGEARPCNAWVFARQFIGGIAMFDLFNATFGTPKPESADEVVDIDGYLREVVDAAERALSIDT